jgi:hypothetical protein
MPTIGQDCHITLTHPLVNGGQPYGFLVNENGGTRPGGVQITHEVDTYGSTRLWIYFDILLADNVINPDGSFRQTTRQADYAMLLAYLSQLDSIQLDTPIGVFLNLGAIGWTADERHLPGSSIMKCQINNVGYYWPPVPDDILAQCVWGADSIGSMNWSCGYWR